MRLAALALVALAFPAFALDFCPSVGTVELPPVKDPCEGLAFFSRIAAMCAAEIPEDLSLQRHAAGILELERQARIDETVLGSMRKMGMTQERISFQETYAGKNRSALAEKRALAVSAGYSQLAQEGAAQSIVTNAVWRYLDATVRPQVANCGTDEAGRKAAGDFAGMLAVSMSHGNPIEAQIIRQLLGK